MIYSRISQHVCAPILVHVLFSRTFFCYSVQNKPIRLHYYYYSRALFSYVVCLMELYQRNASLFVGASNRILNNVEPRP